MDVETVSFDIKSLILNQIFFENLPFTIAMSVVQNQIVQFDFVRATFKWQAEALEALRQTTIIIHIFFYILQLIPYSCQAN